MLNKQLVIGMLRKGTVGDEILKILDLVVEDIRETVCDNLGIANCPENEDEIQRAMILNWFRFSYPSQSFYVILMLTNRQLVIGLLRRGTTGSEILNILDVIVNDYTNSNEQSQDEMITQAVS